MVAFELHYYIQLPISLCPVINPQGFFPLWSLGTLPTYGNITPYTIQSLSIPLEVLLHQLQGSYWFKCLLINESKNWIWHSWLEESEPSYSWQWWGWIWGEEKIWQSFNIYSNSQNQKKEQIEGCPSPPPVPPTKQLPFRVRPPSWHILYRLWTDIISPG